MTGSAEPVVRLLHTFFDHMIDSWRGNFSMQSESRQCAGFDGLPDLDVLWGERNILHVKPDPNGFRHEAARRSTAFAGLDGAAMAADSVETIIPTTG